MFTFVTSLNVSSDTLPRYKEIQPCQINCQFCCSLYCGFLICPYPDPKPPFSPIPSVLPPSLPWPVIIGIPAGVVFILGTVLLWFCQSRKHCSSGTIISAQTLPNGHRQLPRDRALAAADKDCIGSVTYEEYLAQQQQQQLLLAQAAPKVYPKIYSDIHTHTHSHVDGKIHQHQHIHYQC